MPFSHLPKPFRGLRLNGTDPVTLTCDLLTLKCHCELLLLWITCTPDWSFNVISFLVYKLRCYTQTDSDTLSCDLELWPSSLKCSLFTTFDVYVSPSESLACIACVKWSLYTVGHLEINFLTVFGREGEVKIVLPFKLSSFVHSEWHIKPNKRHRTILQYNERHNNELVYAFLR